MNETGRQRDNQNRPPMRPRGRPAGAQRRLAEAHQRAVRPDQRGPAPRGPAPRGGRSTPAPDLRPVRPRRPHPRTARQLAFCVLEDWTHTGEFPTQRLDDLAPHVPPQDRALAMQLVYGVVRRKGTLDTIIRSSANRPRDAVEAGLWTMLRLGTYQLGFLDGVPAHAAVHETVELARFADEPRWIPFLNAILRHIADIVTKEAVPSAAVDSYPLSEGRYRRIMQPMFADPAEKPLIYLADAFSLPSWMVDRWSKRASFEEMIRLGFWFNEPSPTWLRVNALRTNRDAVRELLKNAGIESEPGVVPESLRLDKGAAVESLPGFAEGLFTVQDESAMHAARLLNPQPGEAVLDACAAPGTKTTHLAELMQNTGRIVATDIRGDRLDRVGENAQRLGLSIIERRIIKEDASNLPDELFDAALVDVPCTNTGVLGRRPEVRWRLMPKEVREMADIQTRLLHAVAKRIKPGGRIVYSTCSVEPEENQGVVRGLLDRRRDIKLIKEQPHTPGRPADGGYQALLQRDA